MILPTFLNQIYRCRVGERCIKNVIYRVRGPYKNVGEPWRDHYVYVSRLDMCRRQYANDACNRGTAGKSFTHKKKNKLERLKCYKNKLFVRINVFPYK
jgi:hypothetical protein